MLIHTLGATLLFYDDEDGRARATKAVSDLAKGDDQGWTYKAEQRVPGAMWKIACYNEHGDFVGYM